MPIASHLNLIGATLRDLSYLLKAKPIQHLLNSLPPSERDLLLESSIMLQQALPPVSKAKSTLSAKPDPAPSLRVAPEPPGTPELFHTMISGSVVLWY